AMTRTLDLTHDLIHELSVTEATRRGVAGLVADAENGQTLVVTRRRQPVAAVVGMRRLAEIEQTATDVIDLALALIRTATDSGGRDLRGLGRRPPARCRGLRGGGRSGPGGGRTPAGADRPGRGDSAPVQACARHRPAADPAAARPGAGLAGRPADPHRGAAART